MMIKNRTAILFRTSQSFKERLKDLAKINNKSVSSVIDDLLTTAFIRQERKLIKIDIDETKNKIETIQNTINALNNNVIQMSNRLDSYLKNTSSELDKNIKELIKELDKILSRSKATEEKHYELLDEQIYRLQVAVLETFRLHFSDDVKKNKAVKQLLMIIAERVEKFKSGTRTV